ncbi:hypothetical protein CEP53_010400 [Fusarium sp. AF-6]|nr:hypothetical protein CEP53_010400 [Fusarium sp. AF-6]
MGTANSIQSGTTDKALSISSTYRPSSPGPPQFERAAVACIIPQNGWQEGDREALEAEEESMMHTPCIPRLLGA